MVAAKKKANAYFNANIVDVTDMFVYPSAFASEFTFATIAEQSNIAFYITAQYQKFLLHMETIEKNLWESINPKEIDSELFDKVQHLHKMVLDWKNRAHKSLHTKIMNCMYSRYIVNTLVNASIQKIPFKV